MFLKENCEGVYDIPASRDSPHAPYGCERQRWLVLHQKSAPRAIFVIKIRGPVTVMGTATHLIFMGAAGAAGCCEIAANSSISYLPFSHSLPAVFLPFSCSFPAVFDRSSKACKSPANHLQKLRVNRG